MARKEAKVYEKAADGVWLPAGSGTSCMYRKLNWLQPGGMRLRLMTGTIGPAETRFARVEIVSLDAVTGEAKPVTLLGESFCVTKSAAIRNAMMDAQRALGEMVFEISKMAIGADGVKS